MFRSSAGVFVSVLTVCTMSAFIATTATAAASRVIEIKVTAAGYEPDAIAIGKGEKVQLRITRTTDATCAKEILIPDAKINQPLPLNQPVVIDLAPLPNGEYKFGCHMDYMLKGLLKVGSKRS